jgi:2-keto-4-pentenoate hydratase/2-oxohepta-3-ene-1,7-dioic acid hydratase in catechol pathway
MRYLTFSGPGDVSPRLGVMRDDRVFDVGALASSRPSMGVPASLLELIQAGPSTWREVAALVDHALAQSAVLKTAAFAPDAIRWHAPIPRPSKNIVCLGLNYMSHLKETSKPLNREVKTPDAPIFFTKAPTAVSGPYDPIPWDPAVTEQVDYEAELAVVIGECVKDVKRADALSSVFGYTIVNDVSARDVQYRHKQWFKGKSLDGFCPMGPVVVTADEFGDPQAKQISLRVNGETRQSATTGDMIFPVDAIIEQLSRGMRLEPGDVIATGTPEGVGLGRTPPSYLQANDIVETQIEGIGTMRNRVELRAR